MTTEAPPSRTRAASQGPGSPPPAHASLSFIRADSCQYSARCNHVHSRRLSKYANSIYHVVVPYQRPAAIFRGGKITLVDSATAGNRIRSTVPTVGHVAKPDRSFGGSLYPRHRCLLGLAESSPKATHPFTLSTAGSKPCLCAHRCVGTLL